MFEDLYKPWPDLRCDEGIQMVVDSLDGNLSSGNSCPSYLLCHQVLVDGREAARGNLPDHHLYLLLHHRCRLLHRAQADEEA